MARREASREKSGTFLLESDASSRREVGRDLSAPVPKSLGWLDQLGLWGNVGVSLLGFTGAIFVLEPLGAGHARLGLAAAFTAICCGTVLGALAIGFSGLPGTRTGAPAMVLVRGLLGTRGSYLPTVLNLAQCIGWGTFEVVVISTAAHQLYPPVPRDVYVALAGALTTLLAIHPLRWVRVMRRVFTLAMLACICYLLVRLGLHPLVPDGGSWSGFSVAMDTTVAVGVSWVPLASDYTRHSRSERATFFSALVGFSVSQSLCYGLGLLALVTVASGPSHVYGAFLQVPAGAYCFGLLVLRETDQSFTDAYSIVASTQNLLPRTDRRLIALGAGALLTVLALVTDVADYESFLLLIGSVFVPLFGVLVVDFFFGEGRRWDLSEKARLRPRLLCCWLAGFLTYQLVDPGSLRPWASLFADVDRLIGFGFSSELPASIVSFAVSALATLALVRRSQALKPASTSRQRSESS